MTSASRAFFRASAAGRHGKAQSTESAKRGHLRADSTLRRRYSAPFRSPAGAPVLCSTPTFFPRSAMPLKTRSPRPAHLRVREDAPDPDREAEAIKQCLRYLCGEAMKLDLRFTAHLIGVAAESRASRIPNRGSQQKTA